MNNKIKFRKTTDKHGYLSNFFICTIDVEGYGTCNSSENLYQAIKYIHNPFRMNEVFYAKSAWHAAQLGRDKSYPIRKDWEEVKFDAMRYALILKFTQNKNISQLLLNTGDAILIEYAPNDKVWGDGGDGSGQNMLGVILQEIRQVLRDQQTFEEMYLTTPEEEIADEDIPVIAYELHFGKLCGMLKLR